MNARANQMEFPGVTGGGKTYASWRVWKGSTREEVKFAPLAGDRRESRRRASKIFHHARRFERSTRTRRGHQDGRIGRNGIAVLHALLFDFLNHHTGQLDPTYETIARASNISIRSVARGLQRLKACGVLTWVRRCREDFEDGVFYLRQKSNAYAVLPATQWKGFTPPPEPPPPEPGTWGDHPPMAPASVRAVDELRRGATQNAAEALESDPHDGLALALARLQRIRNSQRRAF
jgi:hypothetical protein